MKYIQPLNTSRWKKSVLNMGIILYNKLPAGIMRTESFKDFTNKLDTFVPFQGQLLFDTKVF
jgi:hypothetical protein